MQEAIACPDARYDGKSLVFTRRITIASSDDDSLSLVSVVWRRGTLSEDDGALSPPEPGGTAAVGIYVGVGIRFGEVVITGGRSSALVFTAFCTDGGVDVVAAGHIGLVGDASGRHDVHAFSVGFGLVERHVDVLVVQMVPRAVVIIESRWFAEKNNV